MISVDPWCGGWAGAIVRRHGSPLRPRAIQSSGERCAGLTTTFRGQSNPRRDSLTRDVPRDHAQTYLESGSSAAGLVFRLPKDLLANRTRLASLGPNAALEWPTLHRNVMLYCVYGRCMSDIQCVSHLRRTCTFRCGGPLVVGVLFTE